MAAYSVDSLTATWVAHLVAESVAMRAASMVVTLVDRLAVLSAVYATFNSTYFETV